ncbi:MAG: zinc-binding dehydrogenase [Oscillospiraceae bacterium]|nr:zinc-binding dehydrogenase [Oscillospiraceae bacterium]
MRPAFYTIDRIEEGVAVLFDENETKKEIKTEELPKSAKEGDILSFDGKTYAIEKEKTDLAKVDLGERLSNLFKKEKKPMKTKAVRIYGENDLRLEEFELPEMKEDEILGHIISNTICMSSHKAAIQGGKHKRVPDDVAQNPVIIGHEFCGEIVKVGKKWEGKYKAGSKFSVQPAMNYKGSLAAPGYSYRYIGGNATYVIIPQEVMETNCLLEYSGDAFYFGSLAEPMSCIVGACHANYHHAAPGVYVHNMGIAEGGNCAYLGAAGPMGLGAIDYAVHCERKPGKIAVIDIDQSRLDRAASIVTVEEAKKNGVELVYLNTSGYEKPEEPLLALTGNKGYDDVFVYYPSKQLVETGDKILARDGCLNFFAGPTDPNFSAEFNFYNVHYASTHIVGTSGGNTDDMVESLEMMGSGKIDPSMMITHVGGLDAAAGTILNLPNIRAGKMLIYTNIKMPLCAITDFEKLGKTDPVFAELGKITKANNGIWCHEAEKYLLENAEAI